MPLGTVEGFISGAQGFDCGAVMAWVKASQVFHEFKAFSSWFWTMLE
jgi:hypothetical protein